MIMRADVLDHVCKVVSGFRDRQVNTCKPAPTHVQEGKDK
jgi:hypothetical protein